MRDRTFYKLTLVICRSTALDWTVLSSYKKYNIKGVSSPTVQQSIPAGREGLAPATTTTTASNSDAPLAQVGEVLSSSHLSDLNFDLEDGGLSELIPAPFKYGSYYTTVFTTLTPQVCLPNRGSVMGGLSFPRRVLGTPSGTGSALASPTNLYYQGS